MNIIQEQSVDTANIVASLQEGKTLVYPTETCYGLGCDATNDAAVDRIFDIKQRQREKSVLVVFPDVAMIQQYVEWTPTLQRLADKHWPGPLTLVAPLANRGNLASGVIGQDNTIAFRMSPHPLVQELATKLQAPLVSTSANISTQQSPYDVQEVLAMFDGQAVVPDMLIDAGVLPHRSPSTIVRVDGNNTQVLRQGEIVI